MKKTQRGLALAVSPRLSASGASAFWGYSATSAGVAGGLDPLCAAGPRGFSDCCALLGIAVRAIL
jgi:hypothetical protein